jgi:hypothetical protein
LVAYPNRQQVPWNIGWVVEVAQGDPNWKNWAAGAMHINADNTL